MNASGETMQIAAPPLLLAFLLSARSTLYHPFPLFSTLFSPSKLLLSAVTQRCGSPVEPGVPVFEPHSGL